MSHHSPAGYMVASYMSNFISKSFIACDEMNRPYQIKTALSHMAYLARRHQQMHFQVGKIASILLKGAERKVTKSAPSFVDSARLIA